MLSEKYNGMPDSITPLQAECAFVVLLGSIENNNDIDIDDALEALYQLADRQWHTYSILPLEYRLRLDNWLCNHWHPVSIESITKVGFIAGAIGLPKVLSVLETAYKDSRTSHLIKQELFSIISELTPKIADPYYGMPRRQGAEG